MEAREAETMRVVIANVRNLMSRAWNRQKPNWAVVVAVFGRGSGRAHETCRQAGIDPDGFSV